MPRNCCCVAVCSAGQGASAPTGRRRAGHILAAARLQLVLITSAKEVMYLRLCVCLSVGELKKLLTNFDEIFLSGGVCD